MNKTLYLGLEVPAHLKNENVVHLPLIKIIPKKINDPLVIQAFENFKHYTHVIFTSRNAVSIFCDLATSFNFPLEEIQSKIVVVVGKHTAKKLRDHQLVAGYIAKEETAEGVTKVLMDLDLSGSHVFLPQSSLARSVISDWLMEQKIKYTSCYTYDTASNLPENLPNLAAFEKIVFTSPSVVNAFLKAYGNLPRDKALISIGPITEQHINRFKA